MLIITES